MMTSGHPDLMKIVQDMGPGAADKIIYSELAKQSSSESPQALTNALDKIINEKGIGELASPELKAQNESLKNRIKAKEGMRALGVTAGSAIAGHSAGLPWETAGLMGAGLGASSTLPYFFGRSMGVPGAERLGSSLSSMDGPNRQLRDALINAMTGSMLNKMNTGQ